MHITKMHIHIIIKYNLFKINLIITLLINSRKKIILKKIKKEKSNKNLTKEKKIWKINLQP